MYRLFHDAVNDPSSAASTSKEKNKKIIGYLCSYTPVELIHAAGFHPLRLFSSKSEISLAENHLQAYCCSLVRGVLEDSLSGKLDFLDGTVFPHTCDSIQRLSDIWRLKGRYEFFADVIMPVKLDTGSAAAYMTQVLTRFKTDLEQARGEIITDAQIHDAIAVYEKIRENLKKLYALRAAAPGIISGADMHALVKGSMIMEPDQAAELLPGIVSDLERAAPPENNARRLLVSGSICDTPDIYTLIEEAGAVVVADDLCTGQRWFDGQAGNDEDPLKALSARYTKRIVCPAKHKSATARGEHLVNLAKEQRIDGVIFMLLKFCDPHAFDYPYLRETLEKAGIKSILIEMDDQAVSHGQLSTRLETFVHMI